MLLLKINSSHFKSAVSEIGDSQRCVGIITENFVPIRLAASLMGPKTAYGSVNEPNSYSETLTVQFLSGARWKKKG